MRTRIGRVDVARTLLSATRVEAWRPISGSLKEHRENTGVEIRHKGLCGLFSEVIYVDFECYFSSGVCFDETRS